MFSEITSKDNPKIKLCISLKSRSKRQALNMFFFEGIKLLAEAFESHINIKYIFIDEEHKETFLSETNSLNIQGTEIYFVPKSIYNRMSDSDTPPGILCVAEKIYVKNTSDISKGRFLALENISDPGNAGAVLRCVEAFSLDGVIISKGTVDVFSPKTIRGSMGSAFRVPVFYSENIVDDIKALNTKGFATFCADLRKDAVPLNKTVFPKNSVTVIGNESCGITKEMRKACSSCVLIPMKGKNESLNASVAAGIIAYEMSMD